ncbi:hypothetical protein D5086_006309 [Populus alba]|uniref:Uncharacterized protein n=1 Tax=Populus alba TaxID=43335 RepID=A0ACC4CKI0_POPAL
MDGEEKERAFGRRSSHNSLSRSISRSSIRAGWSMEDMFSVGRDSRRTNLVDEDEEALKWAAIEKLPTALPTLPNAARNIAESVLGMVGINLSERTKLTILKDAYGLIKPSRTMIIANTGGALTLLLVFLLGGFILPKGTIPIWWEWGYWVSPLSYGYNAIAVNEMFAPRWMNKLASDNATRLGAAVLDSFGVYTDKNWYWIGTAAILGFAVLFNVLFTFALEYFSPPGKPQAIISEETTKKGTTSKKGSLPQSLASSDGNNTSEMELLRMSSPSNPSGPIKNSDSTLEAANGVAPKRGMVLPFTPLSMSFEDVNYFVDMPPVRISTFYFHSAPNVNL